MTDIRDLRDMADDLDNRADYEGNEGFPEYLAAIENLCKQMAIPFTADALREFADNQDCTMIADSYFVEYAQELAYDCGMVSKSTAWPLCHINWEAAAEALQSTDYESYDFGGDTYWIHV